MSFRAYYNFIQEQLKIVAPAVRLIKSGKVLAGKVGQMHVDVYDKIARRVAAAHKIPIEKAFNRVMKMVENDMFEDGFVDSEGQFRTRKEAWNISKGYDKEIEKQDKELSQREDGEVHKKLSSEWIPQTGPSYRAAMAA